MIIIFIINLILSLLLHPLPPPPSTLPSTLLHHIPSSTIPSQQTLQSTFFPQIALPLPHTSDPLALWLDAFLNMSFTTIPLRALHGVV